MRILWYWPFVRAEELPLAEGVCGGQDHLVVETITGAAERGVRSEVRGVEIRDDLPAVALLRERSARWALSRTATYGARARRRAETVRRELIELCHVRFSNYFTDWWALPRLGRRTRLVVDVHDVYPHNRRLPVAVQRQILRGLYRHSGTLVVHHNWIRDRLVADFAVGPERIRVIPHQVPAALIPTRPIERRMDSVLFFGTFRRNKGIEVLLDSASELTGSGLHLRFAGRGDPGLERRVSDAALSNPRIEAEIGRIGHERKAELFSEAGLVVLPYTSFESQSGVLHDAYSYEVPVVVTDVGALGDTVREDGTGWVVAPGSSVDLAEVIGTALGGMAAYGERAASAGRIALERTPKTLGPLIRALYDEVMVCG